MLDMRLDINAIGKFGSLGWASSASSENGPKPLDRFQKEPSEDAEKELNAILKRSEEIKVPRNGRWKDPAGQEWQYMLHGGGCSLIHPETQEPLDWDCPNPKAFDDSFFFVHLAWRLKQEDDALRHVQELQDEAKRMFAELVEDGLIRKCQMLMGLVYILKE